MVRAILTAAAALSILADSAAGAQTANTPPPPAPDHARDEGQTADICITSIRIVARITVGQGRKKIEIMLGGDNCGGPEVSILTARYAADSSKSDAVEIENCPAYRAQINQLRLPRNHKSYEPATIKGVRAGPFTIANSTHLFELRSANGQKAAARWLRQTLAAVRPC
jgi:hypothetical protein